MPYTVDEKTPGSFRVNYWRTNKGVRASCALDVECESERAAMVRAQVLANEPHVSGVLLLGREDRVHSFAPTAKPAKRGAR